MTTPLPPAGSVDGEELDRWEALCEAASPWPWTVAPYTSAAARDVAQVDAPGWCVADCFESERSLADATFIAAARTALPRLTARVRRLEIDLEVMQATHEGSDTCPLWYDGCNCRKGVEDVRRAEQRAEDAEKELRATRRDHDKALATADSFLNDAAMRAESAEAEVARLKEQVDHYIHTTRENALLGAEYQRKLRSAEAALQALRNPPNSLVLDRDGFIKMCREASERAEVAEARAEAAEARVAELEAALRKHGKHASSCARIAGVSRGVTAAHAAGENMAVALRQAREAAVCTCGLDAALSPAPAEYLRPPGAESPTQEIDPARRGES